MKKVKRTNGSQEANGYSLGFAIAKMKDICFPEINDNLFKKILISSGLVDAECNATTWAKALNLMTEFLGSLTDGKLEVNPDRLSPKRNQLCVTPRGIAYLQMAVEEYGEFAVI